MDIMKKPMSDTKTPTVNELFWKLSKDQPQVIPPKKDKITPP